MPKDKKEFTTAWIKRTTMDELFKIKREKILDSIEDVIQILLKLNNIRK
jgi:hypothetical protein